MGAGVYLQGNQYQGFGALSEGANLGAPASGATFKTEGVVGDPASGPLLSGASYTCQGGFAGP